MKKQIGHMKADIYNYNKVVLNSFKVEYSEKQA